MDSGCHIRAGQRAGLICRHLTFFSIIIIIIIIIIIGAVT